jgi:ParB family chromosome partitioning protein
MSIKRGGLGRNLSALLNYTDQAISPEHQLLDTDGRQYTLQTDMLQPGKYQPRGDMNEQGLAELADSIKKQGLLQPLVVREIVPGRYEIIAGERRWRACQLAGLTHVPVLVRQVDDETAMAMALVENLQREELNAIDQARAMQRLTTEFGLTHQQVADLLSKSRTAVSNSLRLLQLNADVRRLLEYGDLDMGHARSLLMLNDEQQTQVAQLVVAKGLSVRETEALVARVKADKPARAATFPLYSVLPEVDNQLEALSERLNTAVPVTLKQGARGRGWLMIPYHDSPTLQRMIGQLLNELMPLAD